MITNDVWVVEGLRNLQCVGPQMRTIYVWLLRMRFTVNLQKSTHNEQIPNIITGWAADAPAVPLSEQHTDNPPLLEEEEEEEK